VTALAGLLCMAAGAPVLVGTAWAGSGLAGSSATLTVSVRVVERCAIAVPDGVFDHVFDRLPPPARARLFRLIEHRCQRRTPARIHLAPGPPPWLAERLRLPAAVPTAHLAPGSPPWLGPLPGPPGQVLAARRAPDSVLVTITY
jgi:hypothetical protein